MYWYLDYDYAIKSFVGKLFKDLDECTQFYKAYAVMVGFDVSQSTIRKHRDGVTNLKYLVCSHDGFKNVVRIFLYWLMASYLTGFAKRGAGFQIQLGVRQ